MEKIYETVKSAVVNFKLESCCCFAPIRIGVLITGYFNTFVSLLSLIGTADGGITPPFMSVQELILEDNASKPLGILAYAAELAFSTLLLSAMYRNDIVLLRVYMYFGTAAVITSVLVYSMVLAAISIISKIIVIGSMIFQCYVILLVRSAIVEIKAANTGEKMDHITLYSVNKIPNETKGFNDVEIPPEITSEVPESKLNSEQRSEEKIVKLQVVDEKEE